MGTFNVVNTDQLVTGSVAEKVVYVSSTSSVTYDCSIGGVFLHTSPVSQNWVAKIVNVPKELNKIYTIAIICKNNSSAAYSPSSYLLDDEDLSVQFSLGSLSSDAANLTKIITIYIIRNSDGTLAAYGNGSNY